MPNTEASSLATSPALSVKSTDSEKLGNEAARDLEESLQQVQYT